LGHDVLAAVDDADRLRAASYSDEGILDVGVLEAAERVAGGGSALDPKVVASLVGGEADSTDRTVEGHVRSVLMKLDLPESGDAHRRVRAVIAYLRAAEPQR
jgi:hypothetical protein